MIEGKGFACCPVFDSVGCGCRLKADHPGDHEFRKFFKDAVKKGVCCYCEGSKVRYGTDNMDNTVTYTCGHCQGTGKPFDVQMMKAKREENKQCTECGFDEYTHGLPGYPGGCLGAAIVEIHRLRPR